MFYNNSDNMIMKFVNSFFTPMGKFCLIINCRTLYLSEIKILRKMHLFTVCKLILPWYKFFSKTFPGFAVSFHPYGILVYCIYIIHASDQLYMFMYIRSLHRRELNITWPPLLKISSMKVVFIMFSLVPTRLGTHSCSTWATVFQVLSVSFFTSSSYHR